MKCGGKRRHGRFRQRRARGRQDDGELAALPDGAPSVERVVALEQATAIIERTLLGLPARCRRVFLLRVAHEWSYEAIAERLQISKRTVEREMQLALEACEQNLKKGRAAMTRMKANEAQDDAREAARLFVRADAGCDRAVDAELAEWIAAQPANERAMQRIDLAVALGRHLAADPNSALNAESLSAARPLARFVRATRALVWGGALAAALLVAMFVVRDEPARPANVVALEAARSVAVEAAFAAGVERDVVAALRTVPGLYVIAGAAAAPYAATELSTAEVGGLLGARGLVDAAVELVDGRVRVSVRLREAATGATLWQTQDDRPVDELRAVRDEIAQRVAAAMFDAAAREQVAQRRDAARASAKPFQQ